VKSRLDTDAEPRADYDESSVSFAKAKTKRTQKKQARKQWSNKRTRAPEEPVPEEQTMRKRLVTFSQDSPKIHGMDTGEKGAAAEDRQGNPTTTTIQNNLPETAAAPSSAINSKRTRDEDLQPDTLTEFNPLNDDKTKEMDNEVNNAFPEKGSASSEIGGAQVKAITGHNWIDGRLKMKSQMEHRAILLGRTS
jgi:hypothetical protein